jgi:8'-apo-carotenoid 13,14-cleaving dioxygenase
MKKFATTGPITEVVDPYLTGVHTPMQREFTIENLPVTGSIPVAFDGRYLRMGPNPRHPNPAKYHWFAGDGMIHGIRIKDGRALWYRNRWIRSEAVAKELGEPRTEGPRHPTFDVVNTNVVAFARKVFGVVEAGSTPVEIGETLETLRYTDFGGTLHGSFTAHPHVDPISGEMQAVCYDVSRRGTVRYVVVDPSGRVRREVSIPVKHGPMIHDCAFTKRFAIVLDLPVTFSILAGIRGYRFPYRWRQAHPARVGLLPREGDAKDIIWCPIESCYVFHTVNSYDLPDGRVVLDVIVHDKMFSRITSGPDSQTCGLERWTIDPATRAVVRTSIDATPQEFPRIDERLLGQQHRYAYTMEMTDPFLGLRLFKQDLETLTREVHDFGPGRHPCEFVFVPAHAKAAEDEGWVVGFVVDGNAEVTDLVILDARNFAGPPLASIRIPHIVTPGFHGNWIQAG